MSDPRRSPDRVIAVDVVDDDVGRPRGTFAIVIIFGLLFALGWLATYFFIFLQRGAPHH